MLSRCRGPSVVALYGRNLCQKSSPVLSASVGVQDGIPFQSHDILPEDTVFNNNNEYGSEKPATLLGWVTVWLSSCQQIRCGKQDIVRKMLAYYVSL